MSVRMKTTSVCLMVAACLAGCSSSGKPAPSCLSVCQAAAACPSSNPNDPFASPPGTSCADSCASGQTIVSASSCDTQYGDLIRCAGAHDQCSGQVAAACQPVGVVFLQCVQSYCSAVPTPVACGGSSSDGGGGSTGAGGGGGAGGLGGGGGVGGSQGACNTVANAALTIDEVNFAAAAPTSFTGGTILPGTYHLTSITNYTGPGGADGPTGVTHKQTEVIAAGTGGALNEELVASDNGGVEYRASLVLTANGSSLGITYVCPTAAPLAFPYTASAGGNVLTIATAIGRVEVHIRQP